MPTVPSFHGWRLTQSITSPLSCRSRAPNTCQIPWEKPVPRTSTTTWV